MAVSLDIALTNLSDAVVAIKTLVAAVAWICGITLIWKGITGFKIFATQTFGSAQRGEMSGPIVYLFVGGLLCYLPSTQEVGLFTIFNSAQTGSEDELIAWLVPGAEEKWKAIAAVLVKYMMLIGFIAFVRGWLILSKMGASGSQPGSMGKGLTHVIGGILLMNIPDFMNLMANTFGFTTG